MPQNLFHTLLSQCGDTRMNITNMQTDTILWIGVSWCCVYAQALFATQAVEQATQAVEQAILSDQVVEEVDDVVQVFNQLAQVANVVVAASSSWRTTVTPITPAGTTPGIYKVTGWVKEWSKMHGENFDSPLFPGLGWWKPLEVVNAKKVMFHLVYNSDWKCNLSTAIENWEFVNKIQSNISCQMTSRLGWSFLETSLKNYFSGSFLVPLNFPLYFYLRVFIHNNPS